MTPTSARDAASVPSDAELSAALGLWYRLRDDDGTLVETVARALYGVDRNDLYSDYVHMAAAAIEAVRGEVR